MNRRKLALIFSLIIWLNTVKLVAACQPTEPDWWFTEHVRIDQSERPIGIGLGTSARSNGPDKNRASIYVVNHTGTDLYILAHAIPTESTVEQLSFELPAGLIPIDGIRASQSVSYKADELQFLVIGFIDHNRREPDRPNNIEVPAPQQGQIQMLFGEQILTFPIELFYELNIEYNPQNGKGDCGLMILFVPFVFLNDIVEWLGKNPSLLIILFLAILGLVLIWRRKKRSIE